MATAKQVQAFTERVRRLQARADRLGVVAERIFGRENRVWPRVTLAGEAIAEVHRAVADEVAKRPYRTIQCAIVHVDPVRIREYAYYSMRDPSPAETEYIATVESIPYEIANDHYTIGTIRGFGAEGRAVYAATVTGPVALYGMPSWDPTAVAFTDADRARRYDQRLGEIVAAVLGFYARVPPRGYDPLAVLFRAAGVPFEVREACDYNHHWYTEYMMTYDAFEAFVTGASIPAEAA